MMNVTIKSLMILSNILSGCNKYNDENNDKNKPLILKEIKKLYH